MTDNSTPTHEQIARRAFEIFTERGQPEGRDLEHWLEAESQLSAAGQKNAAGQTANQSTGNTKTDTQTQTAATAPNPNRATQPAPTSNGRAQGNGRTARVAARK
jgi:hypothetical protein